MVSCASLRQHPVLLMAAIVKEATASLRQHPVLLMAAMVKEATPLA